MSNQIRLIKCLENQIKMIKNILEGKIENYTKYSFEQLKSALSDLNNKISVLLNDSRQNSEERDLQGEKDNRDTLFQIL